MYKSNMLTKSLAGLLLVAGLNATSIQASEVKYDYIEGRYIIDAEPDNFNGDGDGLQMGGSFRIDKDFYIFGSYQTLDLDFSNDIDTFQLGVGYVRPVNASWDANFSLALVNVDANSNDDSGFAIAAGMRGMLAPKIEGRAKLTFIDVNDSDTYITLGGDYFFTPKVSVGIEIDFAGDLDVLSIGAKYYF